MDHGQAGGGLFVRATLLDKPGEVSPSLDQVARAVNLYASAGTPLDHLKFVAVLHGAATAAALDNAHYKQQFGVDNQNL